LSPLLFGIFVELLHELIRLKVPGAGPIVGNLNVPELMYADDVILVTLDDPGQAQELLNCLSLFATIFDMKVNIAPHKTCAMVFRPPNTPRPAVNFTYKDHIVPFVESYIYLGIKFHETEGLVVAANALADSGRKAMFAVLTQLKRQYITQFEFKCRMFDILVEPIMSYGSHVWGPDLFHDCLFSSQPTGSKADGVHLTFTQFMTGVSKSTCNDVILCDLHRAPILYWLPGGGVHCVVWHQTDLPTKLGLQT
jgi:hypothetical protein